SARISQPRPTSHDRAEPGVCRLAGGGEWIRTVSPALRKGVAPRARQMDSRSFWPARAAPRPERDQEFESGFLQRRVWEPSVPQRRSPSIIGPDGHVVSRRLHRWRRFRRANYWTNEFRERG